MKKNGFTLVELLGVMVVLAIITTIAVPAALSISMKIKVDLYCEKVDNILAAAKLYGEDNRDLLQGKTESSPLVIKVKDLVGSYIKKDQDVVDAYVEDPRGNAYMDEAQIQLFLKYNRVYANFVYSEADREVCNS